jgi:LysM repeat protein
MNPSQFVATYGHLADRAAQLTGLNRWTILTQWALETGWASPASTSGWDNLAGIIYHGEYANANGFTRYPSLEAFVEDYSAVLHQGNMHVILAAAGLSIEHQLRALGLSPWAGSHYDNGGGPGSSLVSLYHSTLAPLAVPVSPPHPGPVVSPPSSESGGLEVNERDYLYGEVVKLAHAVNVPLDTPPWVNPEHRTYTVKPGDYLSEIAAATLGKADRWHEIYELNKAEIGDNPNLIHPGLVLQLPLA